MLSELSTNIQEHSTAASGVVFAQHYNGPNGRYIDLCICDHGKGIFASYDSNPRFQPADEAEALIFALEGKSSKNRAEARGFGISTSRSMLVKGLEGSWCVWTGNHAFIETPATAGIVEWDVSYPGTYIALRIPTVIPGGFSLYDYLDK